MQIIQVKAKVQKELFYNEDSMFGVYSFKPISSDQHINVDDTWETFVVTGNCHKLKEGKEYSFAISPNHTKKYGDGYSFGEFEQAKLDTVDAQQAYLKEVVAPTYAESLIKTYPNAMILDLIINNEIDLSKVKGIGEKTFTKILDKINKSYGLAQSIVELRDLKVTPNQMKKLIAHFGSQEILIEKVRNNIYALTEVKGFGFSKVDAYALNRGDDPNSTKRIKACFDYVLRDEGNMNGHTWITLTELKEKAIKLLDIDVNLINKVLQDVQDDKYKTLYSNGDVIALTKYLNYERKVSEELGRIYNSFHKKRKYNLSTIESKLGITYTDEQKNAIKLSIDNGVMLLTGKAGAGKTMTLMGIKETFKDERYISCALSGQAVKVLSGRGLEASTIHRMILECKGNKEDDEKKPPKLPYDFVIIDEMSMVSIDLFLQVLLLIKDGTQLILVGDDGQLPPIGVGSPFADLIESETYPCQQLTKVHRQAQQSGILTYANKVRDGEQINNYMNHKQQVLGELKDLVLVPIKEKEDILDKVLKVCRASYKAYGKDFIDNFQVLTAKKKNSPISVDNLNIEIRKIFNETNMKNSKPFYNFYIGDRVIHNGNNKRAKHYDAMVDYELNPEVSDETTVYNGSIGYIVHIDSDEGLVFIDFSDVDGIVAYESEDISKISLAYAISIHRSQGVGVQNVLLTFDISAFKLLSKQLVYTGMTRASKKLVMIVQNKALHKAINTDLGNTRQTFLTHMLKGGF